MTQLVGILHQGSEPLRTAIGKICIRDVKEALEKIFSGTHHKVTSEELESLQGDSIEPVSLHKGNMQYFKGPYATSPTGKTNPPRSLTMPGLVDVKDGEPPCTIKSKRLPNDKMTPARIALTNTLSYWVLCFVTACWIIATATSAGWSVDESILLYTLRGEPDNEPMGRITGGRHIL